MNVTRCNGKVMAGTFWFSSRHATFIYGFSSKQIMPVSVVGCVHSLSIAVNEQKSLMWFFCESPVVVRFCIIWFQTDCHSVINDRLLIMLKQNFCCSTLNPIGRAICLWHRSPQCVLQPYALNTSTEFIISLSNLHNLALPACIGQVSECRGISFYRGIEK